MSRTRESQAKNFFLVFFREKIINILNFIKYLENEISNCHKNL